MSFDLASNKPKPINRDRLLSTPRKNVAEASLEALTQIQTRPGNEQLLGISTLFAAFCGRFQMDPQELHAIGTRILKHEPHEDKTNIQIEVLRDFAGIIAPPSFTTTAHSSKGF
jgi:hypothetical protein